MTRALAHCCGLRPALASQCHRAEQRADLALGRPVQHPDPAARPADADELVGDGLVAVTIVGDVGAVKAFAQAAEALGSALRVA